VPTTSSICSLLVDLVVLYGVMVNGLSSDCVVFGLDRDVLGKWGLVAYELNGRLWDVLWVWRDVILR